MENDPKVNNHSIPIIITVITVIGSIAVAIIANRSNTTRDTRDTLKPNVDTIKPFKLVSICEKYTFAVKNVASNFKNFKGEQMTEDKNEIVYHSQYPFDTHPTSIIFDKDDRTYLLEIDYYDGRDDSSALQIFNNCVALIDACLTEKFKRPLTHVVTDTLDHPMDAHKYFVQEYISDEYFLEVTLYFLGPPLYNSVLVEISRYQ